MVNRLWVTVMEEAGRDSVPMPGHNPLTGSGKKVMSSMKKRYGDRGENVFYATMNKNKMKHKWEGK